MLKYKIILAGAKEVGKTSLINRYCDHVFSEKMMETIGVAFKTKKVAVNENQKLELTIWEFSRKKKYRLLFPSYLNGAAGALILYDITNKESLDEVKSWVKYIKENSEASIIILIGTKIDLEDQRVVSKLDALKISIKLKCHVQPIET